MRKLNDGLTSSQRYAMRHRRQGLCYKCPRQRALRADGSKHAYCELHLAKLRERYYTRKRRKQLSTGSNQPVNIAYNPNKTNEL